MNFPGWRVAITVPADPGGHVLPHPPRRRRLIRSTRLRATCPRTWAAGCPVGGTGRSTAARPRTPHRHPPRAGPVASVDRVRALRRRPLVGRRLLPLLLAGAQRLQEHVAEQHAPGEAE